MPERMPNHTMPYIDGDEALRHVESFYHSYTLSNPKLAESKKKTVEIFGSKNLEFYYAYYQHGFDPITCSVLMPNKITSRLDRTGPIALIKSIEEYADGSKQEIQNTVVLNNDGMEIDSVSCPGNKGNLLPKT